MEHFACGFLVTVASRCPQTGLVPLPEGQAQIGFCLLDVSLADRHMRSHERTAPHPRSNLLWNFDYELDITLARGLFFCLISERVTPARLGEGADL